MEFRPRKESIVPVSKVADMVIKNWGSGEWIDAHDPDDLHETVLLSLDISNAKKKLKWKPGWNIEKAIEKTVSWYKNVDSENAYRLCAEQIEEYLTHEK